MVTILFTLVVLGLVVYLIESFVPMSDPIRTIFRVIIVLIVCYWLLQTIGYAPHLNLPSGSR